MRSEASIINPEEEDDEGEEENEEQEQNKGPQEERVQIGRAHV